MQAAQAAFAQDVGSGLVKPGGSSRPTTSSTPVQKPTATKLSKPSDPWVNYSTAASLGYTDPEVERMKAEAERRRTQGVAGEWEVMEQPMSGKDTGETDTTPESSMKREAEGPPDSEDSRSFKLRKKVAPSVVDDWDTNLIPIKLKPKKMEVVPEPADGVKKEEESSQPGTAPIKWTSRGWKGPEDEPDGTPSSAIPKDEVETKPVAVPEPITAVHEPEAKETPEVPSVKVEPPAEGAGETGALFRKRKFGGGNRGKR